LARLHILGAGTPTPTADRFGTSYVLDLGGGRLAMFDCGPAATHKLVKAGIRPTSVDHLFFTHHHFDHDVDYPCFLLCRWDQSIGKENQLRVYGPTLTETITERILGEHGAFVHDWKARVNHLVLVHIGPHLASHGPMEKGIGDVHEVYEGDVIFAEELMSLQLR